MAIQTHCLSCPHPNPPSYSDHYCTYFPSQHRSLPPCLSGESLLPGCCDPMALGHWWPGATGFGGRRRAEAMDQLTDGRRGPGRPVMADAAISCLSAGAGLATDGGGLLSTRRWSLSPPPLGLRAVTDPGGSLLLAPSAGHCCRHLLLLSWC